MFVRGQLHGILIENEHAWSSGEVLETDCARFHGLASAEENHWCQVEGREGGGLREQDLQQRPHHERSDRWLAAAGALRLRRARDGMELILGPTRGRKRRLPALLPIVQSSSDARGSYR